MKIDLEDIVKTLKEKNNFYILTHKSPDGDTLGSAFALCLALQKINKNVKVLCSDEIPERYDILYKNAKKQNFDPAFIISVDIADTQLLGDRLLCYSNTIDLCIDHHPSNKKYSKCWYIEEHSAANVEIIYKIIKMMGIDFDPYIATCIYTGISTDTGCFRNANTTSRLYKIAAEMIDNGADAFKINKIMFDTKSKAQLYLERICIDNMEFFCKDKCAVISLTDKQIKQSGASESDCEGLSSIPRKVDGVLVGIFIKETDPNVFKISVRTDELIDASKICSKFDGGGHKCAAGCTIPGSLPDVKEKIISAVCKTIGEENEWNNNNK